MQDIDIRGVSKTVSPIRVTDNAYGFEEALTTADAVRESTWATVLELLGLHVEFGTSTSGPWGATVPGGVTHYRVATGAARPVDTDPRWSVAIPVGPGPVGPAGTQGVQGNQGVTGQQGLTGPQGNPGAVGGAGPIGPQGQTGQQGPIGAQGNQGAVGGVGPIGPQGPQGLYPVEVYRAVTTGVTVPTPTGGTIDPISGVVTTAPALWLLAIPTVQANETLFITRLDVNPATDTASFNGGSRWSAPFEAGGTGPAGPQGPTGAAGANGVAGAMGTAGTNGTNGSDGQQGPMGAQGAAGMNGSDAAVDAANVMSVLNAYATDTSFDDTDAVLVLDSATSPPTVKRVLKTDLGISTTTPVSHPTLLGGISADAIPTAVELTITGAMGVLSFPAITSVRLLIARLATEPDITSLLFSNDSSQTNQIGVVTKYGSTVTVAGGDVYSVWVGDVLVTVPTAFTATVA